MSQISWRSISWKYLILIFLMGFSSGLPLLLTGGTLKLWLRREGVDISTIGYFSWVGMAYSLKFLWAPLLDKFSLLNLGRRRSWMLVTQVIIAGLLVWIGQLHPQTDLKLLAVVAVLVAFFSATQDMAIDAYRREILKTEELGIGSSLTLYGYRVAMLISGGVGVSWVDFGLSWNQLYVVMAGLMLIGIVTTMLAPEPESELQTGKSLISSFVEPLKEFLQRDGAVYILLFVLLFKFGDALSGSMLNPFYVDMGYSNADIGLIAKTFGLASSLVGLFLGGLVILKMGIYRSLWFFGILQALSTAGFAIVTFTGPERWALALCVVFEDISAGMGNAAFVAFISTMTNKKYTATQYAVLASLATVGRNFFAGFSGDMVKALGWAPFFYACAIIAIPGLVLLVKMRQFQNIERS